MNNVSLLGRLTAEATIRSTAGENPTTVAAFNLAVDRVGEGADFISCKAFGKRAEAIEKYTHKGSKIALVGHIQTGKYTNKDNATVYTTDVIVDSFYFCEKKEDSQGGNDFVTVPDGIAEELPFN